MNSRRFSLLLLFLGFWVIGLSPAMAQESETSISYEKFLELREGPDVVVLDATQLEPYFWVVPEAQKDSGITQKELDGFLQSIIPSKDTKVILHCYETFAMTRKMPASDMAVFTLRQNGYKNVYALAPLWHDTNILGIKIASPSLDHIEKIRVKEVLPFTKDIPKNPVLIEKMQKYLERINAENAKFQEGPEPSVKSNATK